jgi:hypothetical protein
METHELTAPVLALEADIVTSTPTQKGQLSLAFRLFRAPGWMTLELRSRQTAIEGTLVALEGAVNMFHERANAAVIA